MFAYSPRHGSPLSGTTFQGDDPMPILGSFNTSTTVVAQTGVTGGSLFNSDLLDNGVLTDVVFEQVWIKGTTGNYFLAGTENADWMMGGVGNDTLVGLGGDDVIYGDGDLGGTSLYVSRGTYH